MRIIGLVLFALSIPFFVTVMKGPIAYRRWGWLAVGAAPFVIGILHLDVSVISWAYWPGHVKGMIVSLLDSLALAIVLTEREPMRGRPLLWAYIAFLLGSAVITLFASPWLASFMWSWQLARSILVFVAVSMITVRPEGFRQLVGGLSFGVMVQAAFSLWQRAHGVTQATGTMGHQNLVGLSTHFALFLCLAAMLAGDRRWLPRLGVAAAMIAVVLTGSRATTGLAGAGVVLLIGLSLLRRPTAFKAKVASVGLVMLVVAAPIALLTLQNRFKAEASFGGNFGGYDERAAFERAAKAMWRDHPFGIGANQYVVKANTDGYSRRAGVATTSGSLGTNVHNTYLLIGTETGWLGLGTFLILLGAGITQAFRLAWARPRDAGGEIALGAAVTLVVVAVHLFYEWVFVTWIVQYLFAITLGLVAGLAKRRRVEARLRRSSGPVREPEPAPMPPWTAPLLA